MPFRMLKYVVEIMERHLKQNKTDVLPVVVSMVVYTGARPYNYSTDIFDLFGADKDFAREVVFKPFKLIDFSKLDEKMLEPFLCNLLMVKAMRDTRNNSIYRMMENLRPCFQRLAQIRKNDYIDITVNYMLAVCKIQSEQEVTEVLHNFSLNNDEVGMITIAEALRRQGKREGEEIGVIKGRTEGRTEGEQVATKRFVLLLLKKRKSIDEIVELTGLPNRKSNALPRRNNVRRVFSHPSMALPHITRKGFCHDLALQI